MNAKKTMGGKLSKMVAAFGALRDKSTHKATNASPQRSRVPDLPRRSTSERGVRDIAGSNQANALHPAMFTNARQCSFI